MDPRLKRAKAEATRIAKVDRIEMVVTFCPYAEREDDRYSYHPARAHQIFGATEQIVSVIAPPPEPTVGSLVTTDERLADGRCFEALELCDDWDGAPFRMPSIAGALAVRVEVTGRKVRRPNAVNGPAIRVRITFVGDGEPDVEAAGWMLVP